MDIELTTSNFKQQVEQLKSAVKQSEIQYTLLQFSKSTIEEQKELKNQGITLIICLIMRIMLLLILSFIVKVMSKH
jgi:hypothetical protein